MSQRVAAGKSFVVRREKTLIAGLAAAAFLRVFLYCAAYPFFDQIDEALHLDLVVKYGEGRMPYGVVPFSDESLRSIPLFQSPEYTRVFASGADVPPPLWELPPDAAREVYRRRQELWRAHGNFEAVQPPLYYAVAGAWYDAGRLLGLRDGFLLYWVRFLNAPLYGLLVWLSWVWMKRLYPGRAFLRLGVPFLVAFFPAQAAYGINNDALSPLLFGAGFYALLPLLDAGPAKTGAHARAGLLTAAALLVKISNVALAGVFVVTAASLAERARRERSAKGWRDAAVLLLCAGVPVAVWCGWNLATVGDLTGGAYKARALGWTPRPLSEYMSHPLFTARGALYFLRFTALTFWRGEYWWHGALLRSRGLDAFHLAASLGLPALAVAGLRRAERSPEGDALALGAFAGVASLLFLAAMSVVYLFPDGGYPNRLDPFIYSGRLIWGMLVPFCALYLRGFEKACAAVRLPPWLALAALTAVMTVTEAVLPSGLFASRYNFFHLPEAAPRAAIR